jgi:hypothetical protein
VFVFSKQKCDKQIWEVLDCLNKRIRRTTQSEIKSIKLVDDLHDYLTSHSPAIFISEGKRIYAKINKDWL